MLFGPKTSGIVLHLCGSVPEHSCDEERAAGYYERGDAPSHWFGAGTRALGLEGAVTRRDLISVLQGRLPNGDDISQRGHRQLERRMGTDLTQSAPRFFRSWRAP